MTVPTLCQEGCKPINFGIVIPNLFHVKQSKLCITYFLGYPQQDILFHLVCTQ